MRGRCVVLVEQDGFDSLIHRYVSSWGELRLCNEAGDWKAMSYFLTMSITMLFVNQVVLLGVRKSQTDADLNYTSVQKPQGTHRKGATSSFVTASTAIVLLC